MISLCILNFVLIFFVARTLWLKLGLWMLVEIVVVVEAETEN